MTPSPLLCAAQLYFTRPKPFRFACVVADMDKVFENTSPDPLLVWWDQDDLVTLELGHLRIYLSCGGGDEAGPGAFLTLGLTVVTPNLDQAPGMDEARLMAIARLLVRRLTDTLDPDEVSWAHLAEPLSADRIEALGIQMFRAAQQRGAGRRTSTQVLRRPVSDSDALAFFGRIPLIAAKGASPDPAPAPAQTGRFRLQKWVQSHAFGVVALLMGLPLGLGAIQAGFDRPISLTALVGQADSGPGPAAFAVDQTDDAGS